MRLAAQELSNRTALETQKLELISEVSTLKLQLTAAERDRRDNEVQTRLCVTAGRGGGVEVLRCTCGLFSCDA